MEPKRAIQKAFVLLQNHVPCFYRHVWSTLTALEEVGEEEGKGREGGEHFHFHKLSAHGVSQHSPARTEAKG